MSGVKVEQTRYCVLNKADTIYRINMFVIIYIIDISLKTESLRGDLKSDVIKKLNFNFAAPSFGMVASDNNIAFTLSQSTKTVQKLNLPTEPPKKVINLI